tara:strand:- start:1713 stop:1853 length:141 start_codon:yes stop_codon:yes gene_type:complete
MEHLIQSLPLNFKTNMHVKNFKKNFFGIEFLETFMHIMDASKNSIL